MCSTNDRMRTNADKNDRREGLVLPEKDDGCKQRRLTSQKCDEPSLLRTAVHVDVSSNAKVIQRFLQSNGGMSVSVRSQVHHYGVRKGGGGYTVHLPVHGGYERPE